jgi:tetratricopeptide (TPR) repeat protein
MSEKKMEHLVPAFGWTKDSAALGYRVRSAASTTICDLLRPDGSREHLQADNEETDPAGAKRFHDRVDKLGFVGSDPGRWAYAGELELTWRATEGCDKDPKARGRVEVGARVPGESATYPIKLAMPEPKDGLCYGSVHPEVVAVSPDGKYIGAIAHGFAAEWTNDYPMAIATVASVAESAFDDAGLAHHQKGDYAKAAELFEKAARADPTSKDAAFNLACALARLGDARVEAALADAIKRGGADAKKKAQKDADFDGVRTKPWFTALTK